MCEKNHLKILKIIDDSVEKEEKHIDFSDVLLPEEVEQDLRKASVRFFVSNNQKKNNISAFNT